MKIIFICFLLFCQNFILLERYEETTVSHIAGHIFKNSINDKKDLKIGLTFPEESEEMSYFPCTKEVIEQAKNILSDRPNGSEVFPMIVDDVVWELKLCHEHNGEIIECGEEL